MALSAASILGRQKLSGPNDLAERLRAAVRQGLLGQGQRLPTLESLVADTGLSYYAVNRAIATLCSEGLLVSRKRAGTFVAASGETPAQERLAIKVFALVAPELSVGLYPTLQKGFDLAAGERGYQIIASSTENDVRIQADTILQLMDKSVAGVAIVPGTQGPSPGHHVRQLKRRGIPVVVLHRAIDEVPTPRIMIPAEKVGEIAAEQILRRGHRRVAFCASQRAGSTPGYERGFRQALTQAGVALADDLVDYGQIVLFTDAQFAAYERRLTDWFDRQMSRPDRPTAIFTSFDSAGEIVYLLALKRGLRVPEDLSIVAVGGTERRGVILRQLACVTLDERRAGALTADLLDQMHQGRRPIDDRETFLIETGFDPAGSLGEAPGSSS